MSMRWEPALADADRVQKALDRVEAEAAALDPSDANHGYSAAQLALGLGDRSGAEVRLRKLVEVHPAHSGATRFGPAPETWDTLGWVRFRRAEYVEAREALARGVEAGPSIPGIRYRLGLVLAAQGDREKALESLREALRSGPFPESEAARSEIARLEGDPSGDRRTTPSPN